jgi:anti-anti-sigma factor
MGLEFTLTQERPEGQPNLTVFHVGGWLDAQSEPRLVEAVQQAKDAGTEYVLIEMGGVDTITSAGIRALEQAYRIMTPRDQQGKTPHLKLCCGSHQVYQVLSITGVLISIPMYEATDTAIHSFGK